MNEARSRKGFAWAFAPVALLGAMFVGWGVMIALALDDPAFGVEPDYYEKAVHFDEQRAQAREGRRLGWSLEVTPHTEREGVLIQVTLHDKELRPIDGATLRATAFHNARSSQLRTLEFRGEGRGRYTHRFVPQRAGLWEFRFEALKGPQRLLQVERLLLENPDGA